MAFEGVKCNVCDTSHSGAGKRETRTAAQTDQHLLTWHFGKNGLTASLKLLLKAQVPELLLVVQSWRMRFIEHAVPECA